MDRRPKKNKINIIPIKYQPKMSRRLSPANEADSPTKTPDTNVKIAAFQTGKQTCFIVLLQAKTPFFTNQILV